MEWIYYITVSIVFYILIGLFILDLFEKYNIFIIKDINKTGWYVFGFPFVILYAIFIKPWIKDKIETKNLSIRELRKAKIKKLNKHFWNF